MPPRRFGGGVFTLLLLDLLVAAAPAAGSLGAADLLPGDEPLPGWTREGDVLRFPQDSLWLHINGADQQYISFGCASLTAANYRMNGGDSEITLEIYEMEDDLGAFGIYALERPPLDAYLAIGAQGYQEGSGLNFFGGRFYVKMHAYPAEQTDLEAMRWLAESIAQRHLSESNFPKGLDLFPVADLVAGSHELVPQGVLGLKGLSRALSARYERDGEKMTLYLVREQDPESAGGAFASVRASLEKHSTVPVEDATIASTRGIQAELRYHGRLFALRAGSTIILITGADDAAWAGELAAALLNNPALSRYQE